MSWLEAIDAMSDKDFWTAFLALWVLLVLVAGWAGEWAEGRTNDRS